MALFDISQSGPASLVASTYLGGASIDWILDLTVAGTGQAYVVGYTGSANLPVTGDAHNPARQGANDAFVGALSADLASLDYLTYLGGGGSESAPAAATNANK